MYITDYNLSPNYTLFNIFFTVSVRNSAYLVSSEFACNLVSIKTLGLHRVPQHSPSQESQRTKLELGD